MKAFESRPVDYPRKRASIACNFCRHRKRKCDGQKPTCGLCTDAGAQCVYQESERVQDVPAEILSRLNNMETLLEEQKEAIVKLTTMVASTQASLQPQFGRSASDSQVNNWDSCDNQYRSSMDFHAQPHGYETPFRIPLGHHTPTGSFFALDRIKNLIGNYPHDYFFRLENNRPFDEFGGTGILQTFHNIEPYRLQPHVIRPLITQFLEEVHPFFPILEENSVHALFDTFPASPKTDARTSLCLTILALGKVSMNPEKIFDIEAERSKSGLEYFAPAWVHLSHGPQPAFSTDHLLPVALLYGSVYLRYILRPLQAWQLIKRASESVQFMITQLETTSTQDQRDTLHRTAWSCYILECDDLAELHHLTRSGIEVVVDTLGFPGFSISGDGSKSRQVFLAMCLIRKILNRVQENSHSISAQHANDTTKSSQKHSIGALEKICGEFDRQLESWFNVLPEEIKPNLKTPIDPSDPYDGYIRARYHATEHIIFRPSLFIAAQATELREYIFESCRRCVKGCRGFILATTLLLRKRSHSNWPRMLALLAAIFTLSIAKSTPSLESLVQDFDGLVGNAIECTQPWAKHFETANVILQMLETIRRKFRVSAQVV